MPDFFPGSLSVFCSYLYCMPSAPGVDIYVAMEIKEGMDHLACQLPLGYMAIILSYIRVDHACIIIENRVPIGGRGTAMFEPVFSFSE